MTSLIARPNTSRCRLCSLNAAYLAAKNPRRIAAVDTIRAMTLPYANRRQNLRLLAAQRGGATSLAQAVGITKGRVSQMIGSSPVGEIGERIARRIEEQLGLPAGWLDQQHEQIPSQIEPDIDLDSVAQSSRLALENLRENLLRLMLESGLSQSELARRTGMPARAINRLVAPIDDAHSPTLQTLQALAFGLRTSVAALLSPGLVAPSQPRGTIQASPSLAKQAGRLVEDFLLASEEDRRALLAQAAEAADRSATRDT